MVWTNPPFSLVSPLFSAHLVNSDSEDRLNVCLHILLAMVAEQACSFENSEDFGPALRVTSTLLRGKQTKKVTQKKQRDKPT